MIPLQHLPGFAHWGRGLDELVARPDPIWVYGDLGSGVSTVGRILADRRGTSCLDDADRLELIPLGRWLNDHPSGVLASHMSPNAERLADIGSRCVALRLENLDEDPKSISHCLETLAEEEGVSGSLPSALHFLPCAGNLRGLRNRLIRWKLLGQLPDPTENASGEVAPEAEDLATHLHHLERSLLHRALRRSYGNRVEAARRLGVSRRQLYLLIQRHGDPLRGEIPTHPGPKRLLKRQVKTS